MSEVKLYTPYGNYYLGPISTEISHDENTLYHPSIPCENSSYGAGNFIPGGGGGLYVFFVNNNLFTKLTLKKVCSMKCGKKIACSFICEIKNRLLTAGRFFKMCRKLTRKDKQFYAPLGQIHISLGIFRPGQRLGAY